MKILNFEYTIRLGRYGYYTMFTDEHSNVAKKLKTIYNIKNWSDFLISIGFNTNDFSVKDRVMPEFFKKEDLNRFIMLLQTGFLIDIKHE